VATAKITLRASRDIPFNKLVLSQSNGLFAHCAALSINAVHEPLNRNPQRLAHADALARAVNLDMAAASWRPTVDNYLGRIPKARVRGISAANRSSEEAGDGQAGRAAVDGYGLAPRTTARRMPRSAAAMPSRKSRRTLCPRSSLTRKTAVRTPRSLLAALRRNDSY
jgi:hypothetical protein